MQHSNPARFSKFLSLSAVLVVAGVTCLLPIRTAWSAPKDSFAAVKQHLKKEGFPSALIAATYRSDPRPLMGTVAGSFHIRESKLNYGQFLHSAALNRARRFLAEYQTTLTRAEKRYGVDRYTIAAILLIESRFGEYTGRTPTLEILSSFALLQQKYYRNVIWRRLSPQDQKRWGRAAFDKKALQRAQWAFQELGALLRWAEKHPHTVQAFRGSSMGAIGWPQFLPSSLLRLGVDGNRDGKIDLFQPTDAIFSIANYLQAHGWNKAQSYEQKAAVIHIYNRSQPYVTTVLGVAAKLRHMEARAHAP